MRGYTSCVGLQCSGHDGSDLMFRYTVFIYICYVPDTRGQTSCVGLLCSGHEGSYLVCTHVRVSDLTCTVCVHN